MRLWDHSTSFDQAGIPLNVKYMQVQDLGQAECKPLNWKVDHANKPMHSLSTCTSPTSKSNARRERTTDEKTAV
ncbi:hypothetical protein CFIMG_000292RA [Ceratocystis fimbriata CBS 114723]|uniref:Uncharacterized protein n=1 Tax=Ceratocystis fimbriata CBS 114723 TaxID=1035309 RepID=A0A2C5XJE3_9PEZI|nr:hypothetical protein CFIMG_000292RA [Ceratocystis fimbriata CBS 114723]